MDFGKRVQFPYRIVLYRTTKRVVDRLGVSPICGERQIAFRTFSLNPNNGKAIGVATKLLFQIFYFVIPFSSTYFIAFTKSFWLIWPSTTHSATFLSQDGMCFPCIFMSFNKATSEMDDSLHPLISFMNSV